MSIWTAASVSSEPFSTGRQWRIFRFYFKDGYKSDHIVGYFGEGRVSSSIESFDSDNHIAITRSGRRYSLPPDEVGWCSDAEYVKSVWMRHNDVQSEEDVTYFYVQQKESTDVQP